MPLAGKRPVASSFSITWRYEQRRSRAHIAPEASARNATHISPSRQKQTGLKFFATVPITVSQVASPLEVLMPFALTSLKLKPAAQESRLKFCDMLPLISLHTALRATRKQAPLEAVPP